MNTSKIQAKNYLTRIVEEIGLEGQSFYAQAIANEIVAIMKDDKLTGNQIYAIGSLVEKVAFRCLNISPNVYYGQQLIQAKKLLTMMDGQAP